MTTVQDCIFCRIVAGELPASVVHENDLVLAFLDIQPVNPGHALVIPKRHAVGLTDLEEAEAAAMFRTARRLAGALRRSGLPCEGVNLFYADGAAAMQEVFHAHLHVIPRFDGDGFGLQFGPHYSQRPDRAVLDAAAGQIAAALRGGRS
jgi:histidine triad (HIT) family protein